MITPDRPTDNSNQYKSPVLPQMATLPFMAKLTPQPPINFRPSPGVHGPHCSPSCPVCSEGMTYSKHTAPIVHAVWSAIAEHDSKEHSPKFVRDRRSKRELRSGSKDRRKMAAAPTTTAPTPAELIQVVSIKETL